MNIFKALRLYVIPDRTLGAASIQTPQTAVEKLIAQTRATLEGGATAIQLRDKTLEGKDLLAAARAMNQLCRQHGAMFIVNDRLDIALLCGAHGLHVGQGDLPVPEVRKLCPPGFIVGVSAQTKKEAMLAHEQGADYLGIGAVFPTSTKEATALGPKGVAKVAASTPLPAVAIGGVSLENITAIKQTGVAGVALVSAIVAAPDITAETRKFWQALTC